MLFGTKEKIIKLHDAHQQCSTQYGGLSMFRFFYSGFCTIALVMFLIITASSTAQKVDMPDGEQVLALNTLVSSNTVVRLAATRTTVYSSTFSSASGWSTAKSLYQVNPLRRIVDATIVSGESGVTRRYALLLDDGTILAFTYSVSTDAFVNNPMMLSPAVASGNQIQYRKLIYGDTIIVYVGSQLYTYQPATSTWRLDTAGLNRATVADITTDNNGAVFAATNRGLMQFNATSQRWARLQGFDSAANCSSVYRTRNGRWFVGTVNRATLSSTDNGASWVVDSAGNNAATMSRFYDDNANNVYSVSALTGNVSALYRKSDGANTWERIDTLLRNYVGVSQRINDLAGEQTLEVGTTFGAYSSQSQGNTWSLATTGIQAEDIYGYQQIPGGGTLVSTGLGIFRKQTGGVWSKIYPQAGFLAGRPLYKHGSSSAPTFVTQLAAVTTGNTTSQGAILVSTDNGSTWAADTSGLSTVPGTSGFVSPVFTVDNAGRYTFIASSTTGTSASPLRIFTNTPPWTLDTNGLGLRTVTGQSSQIGYGVYANYGRTIQYAFGAVYTGQNPSDNLVYSRPYTGGSWVLDTAGLSRVPLLSFTSNATSSYAGSQLLNGSATLYKRTATEWTKIPSPPSAVSDTRTMAMDSAGVLYVGYGQVISNGAPNRGVYATANDGTTWEYAGLDSVVVRGLTATSDGMYAFTNRGTYKLSRQTLRSAVILLNKRTINFDTVGVGRSRDSVVSITNTGNDTLRVSNLRSFSTMVTATPTQFILAPGASRDITIRFSPTASGAINTVIRTVSNTQPDSIRITGFGKPSNAVIQVASRVIAFGLVAIQTSKDTLVAIKNVGTDSLVVTNIQSNNAAFVPTPTTMRLAPDEETMLRIRFSPANLQAATGRLRFISNAAADSILVNGQGQQPESVEDLKANVLNASAYPQPGQLNNILVRFSLPTPSALNVALITSTGETVLSEPIQQLEAGEHTLPLSGLMSSHLTSGLYFLRIRANSSTSLIPLLIVD